MKKITFLVLNWNGEKVISRCLTAIERALSNFHGSGEILVVDNGSQDSSVALIEQDYPYVRLIKLGRNLGFSEGNNIGVRESQGDIVVLVNNDAYVHPNFIVYVSPHFDDDQVFSVSPKVYRTDGSTFFLGRTGVRFHRGMIKTKFNGDVYSSPVPSLFASGGSGAYDRKKFIELGGLLNLLYWEDLELGYRAWKKKAWRTIYEPRSLVYHDVATSFIKVYGRKKLKTIRERNRFLFQWYSISDPLLRRKHLVSVPFLLMYFLFRREFSYLGGFIQALLIWQRFKREAQNRVPLCEEKLKDREILDDMLHEFSVSGVVSKRREWLK